MILTGKPFIADLCFQPLSDLNIEDFDVGKITYAYL